MYVNVNMAMTVSKVTNCVCVLQVGTEVDVIDIHSLQSSQIPTAKVPFFFVCI